jgi:uncharacterized protein DUF4012
MKPPRRHRPTLRLGLVLVGMAALAFVAVVADGYLQAYRIGRQLEATYPKLQVLRNSLAQGQVPDHEAFRQAFTAVSDLRDRVEGARFTFRLTGAMPLAGRPIRAVQLGASAVEEVGHVGVLAQALVTDLFGSSGHARLFDRGRIDLARLRRAMPLVERVPGHLDAALSDVRAIPHVPFFHRLDVVKSEVEGQIESATELSSRAAVGFRLLPAFLGGTGPRNYFLAMQNNADQRGTGGAVLAYGLIRVDRGRIRLLRTGSIKDLDSNPRVHHLIHAPRSIRWYLRAVGRPPVLNNGLNYSPNFPEVARMWARQVEKITGKRIDGAIALDPFAVEYALRDQGSFRVAAFPDSIDSNNVVRVTENAQYGLPFQQQEVLPGQLVNGAFAVLTDPHDVLSMAKNLGTALSEKRTQLWFADRRLQALVRQMGWDGGLKPGRGDFLYLVQEKRNINKVDYFTRQVIDHTVRLLPSGDGRAVTRIRLVNETLEGQNGFVVGPWHPYGLNVSMLNLYVPRRSDNVVVTPYPPIRFPFHHVGRLGFMEHREGHTRVYTKHVEAWPGHPATLSYRYDIPLVARRMEDGTFQYVLTLRHQPLVRPARASVTVRLPAGARILRADPSWKVQGDTATFRGPLTRDIRSMIDYALATRS